MKVVCDACQAKYQIPDERVAGRKLKIRCRKCGNAIVVRGEHASGEVQTISSIPPAEAPPAVEWHVSIDGEQHGPYPTDQMGGMLRAGQLAWDSYVWRETYGDWKAAGDSDTLVRAVAASADDEPTATAPNPTAAATGYIDDEDPTRMALSPTGENLQPVARVAFAARARVTSQPPVSAVSYGARASQPPMNGGNGNGAYAGAHAFSASAAPAAAASYAPRAVSQPATGYNGPRPVSQVPSLDSPAPALRGGASFDSQPTFSRRAEPTLTGERNEDSVLFSAHNLALAASPGNSMPPPAASSQSGGYASGEGSGLIDIRALAALAQTQHAQQTQQAPSLGSRPPMPGYEQDIRSSDAVMRMANQTGAFSHLDSLAPIGRESQAPNRAVPLAILGGSAMIAAAAFLALYIFRPQPAQQPSAATATVGIAEPAAPMAAPTAAPEPAAAPAAEPVAAAKVAPEPADEPAYEPVAAPAARSTSSRSSKTVSAKRAAAPVEHASAKPSKAEAKAAAKEAKEAKASEPAAKEKPASLDDVMLGDSGKKSEPKPEAKPAAGTPDDDLLAGPMPAPKKEANKPRSIDDLLDDAVPAKGAAKSAAASEALPETPTRDQVGAAMKDVTPDVKACAEGQDVETPTAQVAITVTGATGKVTSVRVTGIQGNVGSCIARAVRNASFPKFAKASLSINYPFKLK